MAARSNVSLTVFGTVVMKDRRKLTASEKTVLNADECELTFFFTNFLEANWQSTITANNTRLLHNAQPKFLGVTLDRLLTFGPHIQSVSIKAVYRR